MTPDLSDKESSTRFMVVGPPRGGFTLLLSILNIFYRDKNISKDSVQEFVNHFLPIAANYVDAAMLNYFKDKVNLNDLFYSKEFKILVGGPKWIDEDNDDTICVRKYLGIKGMGDFTFIQYLPKFTMDFDDIIHSHNHPKQWTEDPYYRNYLKFTSIRNPIDIIHSSVYSINALTSEYIQRCISEDDDKIRLELALNKLTNLEFIEGLIKFLKKYLDEFIPVKDKFLYMMRWEDLIQEPRKTIMEIARAAEISITADYADTVWKEIDHRNLTRYHKHSFRKGELHDWRNSITNSHLELFKAHGFDAYLQEFGYPKIDFFNEREYTPVQKKIEKYIKRGEIYKYRGDDDLYTFAFNKTNFLPTGRYKFKTYPRNGGIKIEKSMFRDEKLIQGFIEKMGPILLNVSNFITDLKGIAELSCSGDTKALKGVEYNYKSIFSSELSSDEMEAYKHTFEDLQEGRAPNRAPVLVEMYKSYNIVRVGKIYCGVMQKLGHIDLQTSDLSTIKGLVRGNSVNNVKYKIDITNSIFARIRVTYDKIRSFAKIFP